MKRLQSEWKSIGPVRRSKSEVVWARFRAAADRFFERYHNRHQIALAGKLAEREALVVELEQLASTEEPVADLSDRVQSLRTTWNRSVPIPGAEIKPLADRWQAALARVVERQGDAFKGTELDPAAVRQRMEKLIAQNRDVPRRRERAVRQPVADGAAGGATPVRTREQRHGRPGERRLEMAIGRRRREGSADGLAAAGSVGHAGSARARYALPRCLPARDGSGTSARTAAGPPAVETVNA